MKSKGILIIAVACFVLVGLAVLKQSARSDEPGAPIPALYGITYVEDVPTNLVLVKFSIAHGGYDECYSGWGTGDATYLVGLAHDWGDWCVWATYTRNDSLFMACVDGYREQNNPEPDEVDLYLVYTSPFQCACWPVED